MAGGGKTTTDSTQKLQLPEWLNKGAEGVWNDATAAAKANPVTAYQGPITAGATPNMQAATAMAGQTGVGQADLAKARELTMQGATAPVGRVSTQDFDSAQAAKYMDPYVQQVQGRTLEEMKRQNAMQLDDVGDAASRSKAYGGSRHGVVEAETRTGQNRNMLDYLAQSNSAAFGDSYAKFAGDRSSKQGAEGTNASLDQADAARTLGAGGQMGAIGNQAQGMQGQDIEQLLKTGLIDQETAQRMMTGDQEEFLRMQDAPMQRYMQLMGMLSGAPTDRTTTGSQTQKTSGSFLSTLMGAGSMAAAAFSDPRLKVNVRRLGQLANGLGVYAFRYVFGGGPRVGVMADEVEKLIPAAVSRVFGYRMVDYSKIGG